VIEQAIARERLSHSLLLHGDDLGTSSASPTPSPTVCSTRRTSSAHFAVKDHPDYLALRPKGKMRLIPIGKAENPEPGTMREFLPKLYVTSAVAPQKVAIVYEADRMNVESANAFLKTLEEPPAQTTLLLLTTRPYALLPDDRQPRPALPFSILRCRRRGRRLDRAAWRLPRLAHAPHRRRLRKARRRRPHFLDLRPRCPLRCRPRRRYRRGLETTKGKASRRHQGRRNRGDRNRYRQRPAPPALRGGRDRHPRLRPAPTHRRRCFHPRALTASVDELEHAVGLLRLNLNESAALETFLLAALRLWARR